MVAAAILRRACGEQFSFSGNDPYWANVSLLMHFEGADNSTVFVDQKGKTISRNGDAVIKSGQGAFGSAAGSMESTGYLSIPFSSDLSFSSSEFCIEGWHTSAVSSGNPTLVDFRGNDATNSGWAIFYDAAARALAIYDGPSNTVYISPNNSIPASGTDFTWAVTRDASGVVHIFVNGSQVYSTTYNPPNTVSSGIRIGLNQGGAGRLQGPLDELRITKGVARYTANYTPAASPFPDF